MFLEDFIFHTSLIMYHHSSVYVNIYVYVIIYSSCFLMTTCQSCHCVQRVFTAILPQEMALKALLLAPHHRGRVSRVDWCGSRWSPSLQRGQTSVDPTGGRKPMGVEPWNLHHTSIYITLELRVCYVSRCVLWCWRNARACNVQDLSNHLSVPPDLFTCLPLLLGSLCVKD